MLNTKHICVTQVRKGEKAMMSEKERSGSVRNADAPVAKEPEAQTGRVSDRVTVPAFSEKYFGATSDCKEKDRKSSEDLQREAELEYISIIPYAAYENQVIKAIERLPGRGLSYLAVEGSFGIYPEKQEMVIGQKTERDLYISDICTSRFF